MLHSFIIRFIYFYLSKYFFSMVLTLLSHHLLVFNDCYFQIIFIIKLNILGIKTQTPFTPPTTVKSAKVKPLN